MSVAPEVYVGPAFVGWRSWRILPFEQIGRASTVRLAASGTRGLPKMWEPRKPSIATCGQFATTHEAPWPDCECGLYAYRTREAAWDHLQTFLESTNGAGALGWAFGRVSLWGKVVECDRGWRAEYAYPYAIDVHATPEIAGQLRDLYGVDVEQGEPFSEPEQDDELESLIGDLSKTLYTLDAIGDGLTVLEHDGRISEDVQSFDIPVGHYKICILNVLHRLQKLTTITDASPATAIEVEELCDKLARAAGRLEEVAQRIEQPTVAPPVYAPRLVLDDDDTIVEAVEKASERRSRDWPRNSRSSPGVWATDVARELIGYDTKLRVQDGDAIRVGQHLGRLAREGRIARVSKSYESNRYAPLM